VNAASLFQENRFLATPLRSALTIAGRRWKTSWRSFDRNWSESVFAVAARLPFIHGVGVPFESITIGIPFYLARRSWSIFTPDTSGTWKAWTGGTCAICATRWNVVNYAYRLTSKRNGRAVRVDEQPYVKSTAASRSVSATSAFAGLVRPKAPR